MTTHVFNLSNTCISEGKNLRIIFDKARQYSGVKRVVISMIQSNNYEALVNVYFSNGYRACTNFASYSHAAQWAMDKSNRKGTWWTGCKVEAC